MSLNELITTLFYQNNYMYLSVRQFLFLRRTYLLPFTCLLRFKLLEMFYVGRWVNIPYNMTVFSTLPQHKAHDNSTQQLHVIESLLLNSCSYNNIQYIQSCTWSYTPLLLSKILAYRFNCSYYIIPSFGLYFTVIFGFAASSIRILIIISL